MTQRVAREIGRDGRTLRLEPDGQEVVSFATASYLGLDRDRRIAAAAIRAIEQHGVAFSAPRSYLASAPHAEAETWLEQVFRRPVVLAGSTALAHAAALPVLLAPGDVVFYDRLVHHSVQTALAGIGARRPRCEAIPHADLDTLEIGVRLALEGGAQRVWYCADGIYSGLGDRLDTPGLRDLMLHYPALHAYVDDSHGQSWCGSRGAGSVVDADLPADRTVIATSLGKGFGCTGGLVAVPDQHTKERIENAGPSLMFTTQLSPPAVGAICASARIHLSSELRTFQNQLADRLALVRALVRTNPILAPRMPHAAEPGTEPTPIQLVVLGETRAAITAAAWLLELGYLVNPVAFPAVPAKRAGLRFHVTRAHTEADLRGLVIALSQIVARLGVSDEHEPPAALSRCITRDLGCTG